MPWWEMPDCTVLWPQLQSRFHTWMELSINSNLFKITFFMDRTKKSFYISITIQDACFFLQQVEDESCAIAIIKFHLRDAVGYMLCPFPASTCFHIFVYKSSRTFSLFTVPIVVCHMLSVATRCEEMKTFIKRLWHARAH